jgi:hypothetical protein
MKPWHGLAVVFLLPLSVGCSKGPATTASLSIESEKPPSAAERPTSTPRPPEKPSPQPTRRDNPEVIRTNEPGILRGIVRWEGAMPSRPTLRLRIDPATRGVADAVVRLFEGKATARPEPVSLSLEQGEYRPHVVLARKGAAIELGTVDERADFEAAGASTFSETLRRGDRRSFPLSEPGLIVVRSQLRPERTPAYVWVLEDVPAAVTGPDGQFRLPSLPPGAYEMALWHEDWHSPEQTPRTARVRVQVGPSGGAEVRWTLTE